MALGCGNFGGIGSSLAHVGQGESRDEAFAIMDAAWEAGIHWFDTADAYGGGSSETWIGEWMRSRGVRPRLTTKTFNPTSADDPGGLAPERVRRRVEISLERLGVERIDVFLLHDVDSEVPAAESLDAVEHADELGVSNVSAEQLEPVAHRVQWVQNEYSLLARGDDTAVLPLCRAQGIRYQAFSPLAGGWLADRYRRGEAYPEGSRMALRPGAVPDDVFDRLDELRERARERDADLATYAIAWALGQVDSVVIGPRRPEHLTPALAALTIAA